MAVKNPFTWLTMLAREAERIGNRIKVLKSKLHTIKSDLHGAETELENINKVTAYIAKEDWK